jgi:hypothetical protein
MARDVIPLGPGPAAESSARSGDSPEIAFLQAGDTSRSCVSRSVSSLMAPDFGGGGRTRSSSRASTWSSGTTTRTPPPMRSGASATHRHGGGSHR